MYKNIKNNEEKKYRGDVLFVTGKEETEIENLLSIIFSMVEQYVRQENRMPSKIVLSREKYNRIKEHNKSLIEEKDGIEYILCTEIAIDERESKIFKKVRNKQYVK